MSDKKTSGTATSATKKAAAKSQNPVKAAPAPPKAEVDHKILVFFSLTNSSLFHSIEGRTS